MTEAGRGRASRSQALFFGAVAVIAAAALLAPVLLRGWYPHDEGALGQAAERILLGEVPHRDFDEIYTGLLSYWHAAWFAIGGIASATLRWPLFAMTLAWTYAIYRLALRSVPAWTAALVAILCVLWSVPNYPAPMPSWYNLFLATFGALALVRWRESSHRRWLVIAGLCGGLSFLVKLSGLAFLIGAGLAIVYVTAASSSPARDTDDAPRHAHGATGGSLLVAFGIGLVLLALWVPLARAGDRPLLRLWLPIALVGGALIIRERQYPQRFIDRLQGLLRAFAPFLLGVFIPVTLWSAWMLLVGGFDEMLQGVFVTPFRRVASAAVRPPALSELLGTALVALAIIPRRAPRVSALLALGIGVLGALLISESGNMYVVYRWLWYLAWGFPMLAAAWGAGELLSRVTSEEMARRRDVAVLLTSVAISALLVEFPFAAPIYTLYALPLALLAVTALVRIRGAEDLRAGAPALTIAAILLLFGALRLYPGRTSALGDRFAMSRDTVRLDLPRAGLLVTKSAASQYAQLVGTLQELAPGRRLWAGPDAPEVYFLSGERNRTRVMFDFLDTAPGAELSLSDRVLQTEASLIVLKTSPSFSTPPSAADLAALRARFPEMRALPGFLVLWR